MAEEQTSSYPGPVPGAGTGPDVPAPYAAPGAWPTFPAASTLAAAQPPVPSPPAPQPPVPEWPSWAADAPPSVLPASAALPAAPQPTVPEPTMPLPAVPQPTVPEPTMPLPAVPQPPVPDPTVPLPALSQPPVPQPPIPQPPAAPEWHPQTVAAPLAAVPPSTPNPLGPQGPWAPPTGTPADQSYAYAVASAPVRSVPKNAPVRNNLAVQIVALIVAFLLGAGSLAVVERLVQAANPAPVYPNAQGRTPRYPTADPNNPVTPGGTQPTPGATVRPRSSGTTVTPEQSAGVVLINTTFTNGSAAGTGMVLSPDGAILTNYHVVAGSEQVSVTIADTGTVYNASVVGFDQSKDVALLQLQGASGLATVTIDNDKLSVGDQVSVVGNADGRNRLVRADGQVGALKQDLTVSSDSPWGATEDLAGLIQTDAKAVPGDSGGPMFDSQNEVTGMTTAGSSTDKTSFAVPIADAMQVVQTIQAGKDVGTTRVGPAGYLGIKVATGNRGGQGQFVTDIVKDGPADKIGMVSGSTLTSVDGHRIRATTNLASVIRVLEPGDKVVVEWITPDGQQKSATATVGASPIN